jgi:hypothetical protein
MGFATTISQLTQQSGIDAAEARREQAKIAAAALTSNAEAQSHAAAAKGAIWGSAISNIGQSIGEIPAQMNRSKALDLQMKDTQAQIDERKAHAAKVQQEDAENQQVDRAFQESLRPDGTVDMQAFSSKIPGSKQQVYLPLIEKVNAEAEEGIGCGACVLLSLQGRHAGIARHGGEDGCSREGDDAGRPSADSADCRGHCQRSG